MFSSDSVDLVPVFDCDPHGSMHNALRSCGPLQTTGITSSFFLADILSNNVESLATFTEVSAGDVCPLTC